jgi:predicted dehydrogenase
VHEDVASNAGDDVNGINGDDPKLYKDYRELLEKEKPEIVIIATPDHWHALQTIAAARRARMCWWKSPRDTRSTRARRW